MDPEEGISKEVDDAIAATQEAAAALRNIYLDEPVAEALTSYHHDDSKCPRHMTPLPFLICYGSAEALEEFLDQHSPSLDRDDFLEKYKPLHFVINWISEQEGMYGVLAQKFPSESNKEFPLGGLPLFWLLKLLSDEVRVIVDAVKCMLG